MTTIAQVVRSRSGAESMGSACAVLVKPSGQRSSTPRPPTLRRARPADAAHLGEPAMAYHAGVEAGERDREHRFLDSEVDVMVTNAFGMGVDKADVRSVIHWACPPTPEALPGAGRAGRGAAGRPAKAILLYCETDLDDACRLAVEIRPQRERPGGRHLARARRSCWQPDSNRRSHLAAMANLRERVEPRVVLANLERAGLVRSPRFTGARQYELIGETPDDATVIESLIVAMLSSSPVLTPSSSCRGLG